MRPDDAGRRAHDRARVALQVSYRSTGSFLVSYSVDLSQGGLFLETARPREIGTELELRLTVPGAEQEVRLRGTVMWIREQGSPGEPPGMGIQFQDVETRCGKLIDGLVRQFMGLRILVASSAPRLRAQLGRQLRSAVAAVIEEHALDRPYPTKEPFDLVVLDLGDGDEKAFKLLREILRGGEGTAVVGLSPQPQVRQQALDRGVNEAIGSPPHLSELRSAAIRAVGRPMALRAEEMEDE